MPWGERWLQGLPNMVPFAPRGPQSPGSCPPTPSITDSSNAVRPHPTAQGQQRGIINPSWAALSPPRMLLPAGSGYQ